MLPSILRIAPFRNLWIGQLISQMGDALYALVFLWLVLDKTGSEANVGIAGACMTFPTVLLSLWTGALADKHDRRLIMLAADLLSTALVFAFLAVILFQPKTSLAVICLFAFSLSSSAVLANPARSAAVPRLVSPERLREALALNSATQSAMPLAGNAISALVLQALFVANRSLAYVFAFVFNGLTFLFSALFIYRVPPIPVERVEPIRHPLREAIDGLRFIGRHKVLLPALFARTSVNFFLAPFLPVYVVVAKDRFHGTPGLLGFLETGFCLGMVIGSVLVMKMRVPRVGVGFSIYFSIAGLTMFPLGYIHSVWPFWIINLLCGIVFPPALVPLQTLIQLETPDHLRGRVSAAFSMIASGATPIGMLLSGPIMQRTGIAGTFLFMGVGLTLAPLLPLLETLPPQQTP